MSAPHWSTLEPEDAFKASHLPDRVVGSAAIVSGMITQRDAALAKVRALRRIDYLGIPIPGPYKALKINGGLVMSDTRFEWNTNSHAIFNAYGRTLIAGLGLGCVVRAMLVRGRCASITVVEKNRDVIELLANEFNGWPVEIIHADALEWRWPRGSRFDFVYHDIWPDICGDNVPEMRRLKRRYGRLCSGNQAAWCEEFL